MSRLSFHSACFRCWLGVLRPRERLRPNRNGRGTPSHGRHRRLLMRRRKRVQLGRSESSGNGDSVPRKFRVENSSDIKHSQCSVNGHIRCRGARPVDRDWWILVHRSEASADNSAARRACFNRVATQFALSRRHRTRSRRLQHIDQLICACREI